MFKTSKFLSAVAVSAAALFASSSNADTMNTPSISAMSIHSGLESPWDMAFTKSGDMFYTEKCKGLSVRTKGGKTHALYGMKASLVDYSQYGQWQSCVTTGADNETYDNFCEETFTKDAYPSTDTSTIDGSASIFHDIRISQMSIVQGFNADGSGQGTIMVNENTGGDLNVGTSYLHVEVEHRGSSASELYDWSVDFSVTDSGGATVDTDNVTTCDAVEPAFLCTNPLKHPPSASSTTIT